MESDESERKKRERSRSISEDKMSISENSEENKSENNIIKYNKANFKRKTYTIQQKLKIINEAETTSFHALEKKYNISRKNLRRWKSQKNELESLNFQKTRKNLIGAGAPPQTLPIEKDLEIFIKKYREIDIAINTHELVCEAIKLMPELLDKSYHALMNWCYRFLKRIGYSIKKVTHQAQELKNNSKEMTSNFFNYIYNIRKDLLIFDKYELIGNVDETAIYYENIYNTAIERIGGKNVSVRTFGKDKLRISAVLSILANGLKLPPLLIFRGKTGGPKEKKLQKNIHCIKGEIYIKCQDNAWTDTNIFSYWLNNIWFAPNNYRNINNTLLVLDRATTHFDDSFNKLFENHNSKYVMIPPGQTCFLQPLDTSINKCIKQFMRQEDTLFRIKTANIRPPSEEDIIEMFVKIWYDETKIRKDVIIKSFKTSGISTKMDGSDKNEINLPEIIIDEILDPEDYINLNNSIMNDSDISEMNESNRIRLKKKTEKKITDYFK